MTKENTEKTAEETAVTTVDNASGALVDQEEAGVILKDDFHGGTGLDLLDQGSTTVKLDAKRGKFFYVDEPDELFESLEITVVDYRVYFRKFGDSGVICSSDDGKRGYDSELQKWKSCLANDGECPFSHQLRNFQGEGQCTIGASVQAITVVEGNELPIQINMSKSSTRGFKTYCEWLHRKNKTLSGVTTEVKGKHITAGKFQYYAMSFSMSSGEPLVDVEAMRDVE